MLTLKKVSDWYFFILPFFFKYSDAVLHSNPILSPTMSLSTFASIQGYSGCCKMAFRRCTFSPVRLANSWATTSSSTFPKYATSLCTSSCSIACVFSRNTCTCDFHLLKPAMAPHHYRLILAYALLTKPYDPYVMYLPILSPACFFHSPSVLYWLHLKFLLRTHSREFFLFSCHKPCAVSL